LIFILYSAFFPWNLLHWDACALPFIVTEKWYISVVYDIVFIILYGVACPLAESLFYMVFQANQWDGLTSDIMICAFYGLSQYLAFMYIISSWIPQILFGVISGFIMFGLIYIRDKRSFFVATGYRVGVSLAVVFWILFMKYLGNSVIQTKQPTFFWKYNPANILGVW